MNTPFDAGNTAYIIGIHEGDAYYREVTERLERGEQLKVVLTSRPSSVSLASDDFLSCDVESLACIDLPDRAPAFFAVRLSHFPQERKNHG